MLIHMNRIIRTLIALSVAFLFTSSVVEATPVTVNNFSFEAETNLISPAVPSSWTGFNDHNYSAVGSANYSVINPLAPPADGNNLFLINEGPGDPTGGIYQDVGPLQANTVYTLTVAIGLRADFTPGNLGSPGIISLINGTNNTGTLLASASGVPATSDTWQNYSVSYTTGSSVSGDLTVELSVAGASTYQANFDNVRLNAAPSAAPPPRLAQNTSPASALVAVGSNVVFTAAFSNSTPVNLQWQRIVAGSPNVTNNVNTGVVNVTNNGIVSSTLTLNNVQLANAGSYQLEGVNATNSAGVAYSTPAPLTIIPTITWYAAGAYNGVFSNNTVLALAGPVANEVYGVDFGGSGQLTTANGYSFNDYAASGNMTLNGTLSTFGGYLGSATTGDFSLDTILNNGLFGSAANTGTLNNLTVGQTYTVMVLLDDTRGSSAGGPAFYLTDGLTRSPAQQYAFANGVPEIGGYIMGSFAAQAATQPLTILNGGNSSQYTAILLMKGIAPPPANPPVLTTDLNPLLSEVAAGGPVTLSVLAAGAVPLHYQWFNQNGPINGQTNSSCSFNAVSGTNYFYVGVSNVYGGLLSSTGVVISSTNIVSVANFSFEKDNAGAAGQVVTTVPSGWTAFNEAGSADIGSQWAGGTDYTVFSPLAPPASGNQFCYINMFNPSVAGGIYYDTGALQTNTIYTLTVSIGSRSDRINSPGIISLIKGTNNAGTVVATGGGLPASSDTWQDYSVIFTNGSSAGDLTIALSVIGNATTIQADFDNVRLTKAPGPELMTTNTAANPSFEVDVAATGSAAPVVPTGWTAFNQAAPGDIGSQNAGGTDYTIFDPLAPPASGNQFCYINMFNPSVTGGIYQDTGPMRPNMIYTLTVAIGSRADRVNSPGIISLLNGTDNTGTVLATGGGLPAMQDTWQDYSVSVTNGASVSGDLTIGLSVLGNATTIQADFDNVMLSLTPFVPAPKFAAPMVSGGKLILTGIGGTANGSYVLLSTTNLSNQIWTTNSIGTLNGAGAFSNSIPIGAAPASFYRLRVP